MPSSVRYIGHNVFVDCIRLKQIDFGGTVEEWENIDIGINEEISVVCKDGVYMPGNKAKGREE